MRPIFSRTWSAASLTSTSIPNETLMRALPSSETASIFSIPSTVLTIFSTGRVMIVSIFSGAMPGYSMITETPWCVPGGMSETGRRARPMRPKMKTAAKSMKAVM